MYNNSLIQLVTTSESTVSQNGSIPLTTIQRRRGKSIQSLNSEIVLTCNGYYKISGTITFTTPTAGDASIQCQKNSSNIIGLTSSTTTTTATEKSTLYIDGIIRVLCCEGLATISLINTGVEINIINASVNVEYLN